MQQSVKSYRVHQFTVANRQTTERMVEYVALDRYHMTAKNQEFIIIGSKVYQYAGKWIENPFGAMVKPIIDEFRRLPEAMSEVRLVGPDLLKGTPTTEVSRAR